MNHKLLFKINVKILNNENIKNSNIKLSNESHNSARAYDII